MATLLSGAPKIKLTEQVIGSVNATSTYYGGMVFGGLKGKTYPVLSTSYAQWVANYGNPDTDWSFAGLCAKGFLTNGPGIWGLRVVENAYYASSFIVFDLNNSGDGVSSGSKNVYTINNLYVSESHFYPNGGSAGVASAFVLRPSDVGNALTQTSVSVTLNVSGSINTSIDVSASLSDTSSVSNWLNPLATAIIAAANSQNVSLGSIVLNSGHIFIYAEEGISISLTSQTTVEGFEAPFIQVFAADPGATYANNYYAAGISSFSTGLAQITQLKVSSSNAAEVYLAYGTLAQNIALSSADSISDFVFAAVSNLNSFATTNSIPVTFSATDSAGNVVTSGSTASIILATATQAGNSLITFKSDSTNVTVNNKISGLADPNTFKFNVYSKSNLTTPLETFTVSLNDQVDANNVQQYIEDMVNGTNGLSASSYVRAYGGNLSSSLQINYLGLNTPTQANATLLAWLNGGDDGSKPTTETIITGWDTFLNTESYKINLLINAGYTDPAIQEEMATIADTRLDCEAIIDLPQDLTTAADAASYRTNTLNIYTSRAGCYTPFVKVLNPSTNRYVWCPPSGHVASQFSYTANNFGIYQAPAGSKHGVLSGVTDVYVDYHESGDLDTLDAAQINVIRKVGGAIQIDNDKTMINNNGPLSSMNVRTMVTDIETYAISVATSNKFELDNSSLGTTVEKTIEAYIEPYKNAGAITDYAVICDDTNNGPIYLDNAQRNITILLIPVRATRYFLIGVGIGTNAVGLAELEASGLT